MKNFYKEINKLLQVDKEWLATYISDIIAENEVDIELALKRKDRRLLESIFIQNI